MKLITSKIMLLLTIILLCDSTLFASKNKPIYTIKGIEVHRSLGTNQNQCVKTRVETVTKDGKLEISVLKCQHANKTENQSEKKH